MYILQNYPFTGGGKNYKLNLVSHLETKGGIG